MMIAILVSSSVVAFFLILWFRTEAWVEYCRLFRFNRISFYKDYDEKKQNDVTLTYHGYLRQFHNCFQIRLLTCPICVSVWLSIIIALFIGHLAIVPMTFVGGLILFGIIDRLLG